MTTLTHPAGRDRFRPAYHFTSPANWINDPNGLVHYAGEYHLFYQYHPESTLWGPMHWGHAVSRDLVHWDHLPIALVPDELGTIFSGSAVIDWQNTAGLGQEVMFAIFTHDNADGQRQSVAYSHDKGRTWTQYAGNPVLDTPAGEKDFRDPKVFWFAQENLQGAETGHWVMLLAVGDSIWVYTSPDLLNWRFASEFGENHGLHAGVWETPDLFLLPVEKSHATRWVLSVGVGAGADVAHQCTQYFVGDFDGFTFTNAHAPDVVLRADFGPDFYAAQGWNEAPDGRKVWIAWMSNWVYARETPTSDWRGAMSLPRDLALRNTPAGLRLVQQPLEEAALLRGLGQSWENQFITERHAGPAIAIDETAEIIVEFQVDAATTAARFGLRLCAHDQTAFTMGYDRNQQQLYIERPSVGEPAFNPHFSGRYSAPLEPVNNVIRLHIFVDRCSVELFGNHGLATITALFFAEAQGKRLELFAEGGQSVLQSLTVFAQKSALS